jgi:hypothetical protein
VAFQTVFLWHFKRCFCGKIAAVGRKTDIDLKITLRIYRCYLEANAKVKNGCLEEVVWRGKKGVERWERRSVVENRKGDEGWRMRKGC